MATSILGIVLLLVYGTLNTGVRQAADVEARLQIEADVRLAADTFERDLRQAHTGDASLNRIASMAAAQITFYSPDRATPYHLRKISYRMTGTTLQRSVTTSTDTDGFPWVFPHGGAVHHGARVRAQHDAVHVPRRQPTWSPPTRRPWRPCSSTSPSTRTSTGRPVRSRTPPRPRSAAS